MNHIGIPTCILGNYVKLISIKVFPQFIYYMVPDSYAFRGLQFTTKIHIYQSVSVSKQNIIPTIKIFSHFTQLLCDVWLYLYVRQTEMMAPALPDEPIITIRGEFTHWQRVRKNRRKTGQRGKTGEERIAKSELIGKSQTTGEIK